MKKITSLWLLILFIGSSTVFGQSTMTAKMALQDKTELQTDKEKLALMKEGAAEEQSPVGPRNVMSSTDEQWDVLYSFSAQAPSCQAVATDGQNFYMTYWNGGGEFDKFDMDGNYIESFTLASAAAIRDMAYDGQYFYGAPGGGMSIAQLDLANQTVVSTITISGTAGVTGSRHLAYDPELDGGNGGFWLGQWGELAAVDMSGNTIYANADLPDPASCYGSAYDPWTDQGSPKLWLFTQNEGSSPNDLVLMEEFDINSLSFTGTTFDVFTISGDIPGYIPGTAADPTLAGGVVGYVDANNKYVLAANIQQSPNLVVGLELAETGPPLTTDVSVLGITSPNSGVELTDAEPVMFTIKNNGTASQSNIDWEINWDGPTGFETVSGTFTGTLATGETADIDAGTADLSVYGEYDFEACISVEGDENPDNDCKTKTVINEEPSLCVENLYSSGCSFGDGLISWTLENVDVPDIPCEGTPPWYHDYTDQVHNLAPGDFDLTVVAGYGSTNLDVWIDFNDDLDLTDDELVLNDAALTDASTPYTFTITVPAGAAEGQHILRYRTNWISVVEDACETYSYGNCSDFTALIGEPSAADVGVASLDMATFYQPGTVTPMATVKNFGGDTQSFDVTLTIDGYSSTVSVSDLAGGATEQVTFDDWNATEGTYTAEACTDLAGDENPDNDCKSLNINVMEGQFVYAYNAYDPSGSLVEGPVTFDITMPDMVSLLAPTSSGEFIAGGVWAADIWWGAMYTGGLYTIDTETGDMVLVGTGPDLSGLAFDGTTVYGASITDLYEIDPATGQGTMIGAMGNPSGLMIGIGCNAAGDLYGYDIGDDTFYSIDKATGAATAVGAMGYNFNYAQDMAFDKVNDVCYLAGYTAAGGLYTVDVATGAATFLGEFQGGAEITGFAIPGGGTPPPTAFEEETFEDYNAGDYLMQQAVAQGKTYWSTWSAAPGSAEDPFVTDAAAYEGSNSVVIEGTNDAVLYLNDDGAFTEGVYTIDFYVYIPTGNVGYFNALQLFDGGDSEWGMQAYFDVDGAGLVDAGGAGAGTFIYTYDTWHNVQLMIDLDTDNAKMYLNGEMIVEWQWSTGSFGTGTLNELHAMNFYAWAENGTPGAHFDNISITEGGNPPVFAAPTEFEAMFVEDSGVETAWVDPTDAGTWVGYDDGVNVGGLGLNGGGTFWGAIRWEPADLAPFDGMYMTKFQFFPSLFATEADFTFMIWEGADAANLVYEQELSGLTWDEWNTIALDTEHMIDASQDLWIGFMVTHVDGETPLGYDNGPAVAGYGDMVSFDGSTWESLTVYEIDNNFNLKGFIAETMDGVLVEKQVLEMPNVNITSTDFATRELKATAAPAQTRAEFLGVNIYRDDALVNAEPVAPGTQAYTDAFFENGTYMYTAKAVYDEGLSEATPAVEVTIDMGGGPEIEVSPTSLSETHIVPPAQQTTQELTITNTGSETLDWEIEVNLNRRAQPNNAPIDLEAAQKRLEERLAANGLPLPGVGEEQSPVAPRNVMNNTDEQWDVLYSFSAQAPSCQAVATDGQNFYMTYWNGGGEFDKFDMDGNYIESFTLASAAAIRDMAYDGQYFYGAPGGGTSIAQLDLANQTVVSTITISGTAGVTGSRHLAYDPELDGGNGGFWLGQWGELAAVDMSGNTIYANADLPDPASCYGSAYDPYTSPGSPKLWLFTQNAGASPNDLVLLEEFDINSLSFTGTTFDVFTISGDIPGYIPGTAANPTLAGGVDAYVDANNKFVLAANIQQSPNLVVGLELGDIGPPLTTDVSVLGITSPNTGIELTDAEPVMFTIKNNGTASQSNIAWEVTWDGPTGSETVNGTFTGTLATGETADIDAGTADLSELGDYTFEACATVAGDENPDNDCKTKMVTNELPAYCDASTTNEDEIIGNVLCGDIDNSSGWQGGVADYTDISTTIAAGESEDITVTNTGGIYATDLVTCWADWNMDYEFGVGTDEEFVLTNVGGTGEFFEGAISVPAGTPDGTYRLRVRMTYSTPPEPCGNASWGEIEDYSIVVSGSTPSVWLSVDMTSGSLDAGQSETVMVTFDSDGLELGLYEGNIMVTSNAQMNPTVDVPSTLTVTDGGPIIEVTPLTMAETHVVPPAQQTTQELTIANTGTGDLDWEIELNLNRGAPASMVPMDPEAYQQLVAERMASEGVALPSTGLAPKGSYEPLVGGTGNPLSTRETFYAYNAYDPSGALVEGPISFDSETPGALTLLAPTSSGDFIAGGVWAADTWWGVQYGGGLYSFDTETGDMTFVGNSPDCSGLAFDGETVYGASITDLYEIDPATGQGTMIGSMGNPSGLMIAIACDGNGELYGYDIGDDTFYSIDKGTGAATAVGPLGYDFNYAQDMAFDNDNDVMYLSGYTTAGGLYTVDVATGAATFLGEFQGGAEITGFAIPFTGVTYTNDLSVSSIVSPVTGVELSAAEDVIIKIKNNGTAAQSGFDWEVTWDGPTGSGSYSGVYSETLAGGESVEANVGTADLSVYGDYTFEACVTLSGDENPDNDCKQKTVTNNEPSLCIDGLYTSGCGFGDGLISWNFANIDVPDIPCSGNPEWYHDYTDQIHEFEAGQTYTLTVVAGYGTTNFDVWIDWNDDLDLTDDELILNDGVCADASVPYTFEVTIPADAPGGDHILRFRTNWIDPVVDACEPYTYGNCADFKANAGGVQPSDWLYTDETSGSVNPGESQVVTVFFNSEGLDENTYTGELIITSNAVNTPTLDVPCTLVVENSGTGPLAPINLEGEVLEPDMDDILLTWEYPGAFDPQWITYSAEDITNSIGTNAAANFDVAARWEPGDLTEFENAAVTKINFVPGEPGDLCTYTLKVWQGTTPPTLIYEQELTDIVADVWNEVTLDTPVPFDNTQELWIGFNNNTTAGFPAGCDDGPQVEGYSNMMFWNGSWVTLTSLNPDLVYNWAVQGYIEFAGDAAALLPIEGEPVIVDNQGSLGLNPVKINPPAIFVPESTDAITYNVYRQYYSLGWEQIANGISEMTYTDMNLDNGEVYYYVTAVNDEGLESDPSEIVGAFNITVGIDEVGASSLTIYPNPTSGVVNIESSVDLKSVKVMNLTGQVVYNKVINGMEYQFNTSDIPTGVYTLQLETEAGTSVHKLIVK